MRLYYWPQFDHVESQLCDKERDVVYIHDAHAGETNTDN